MERNPGSWHESQRYIEGSRKKKRITYAEELVGFGRGDAGVGGEAVEVVEAGAGGPGR